MRPGQQAPESPGSRLAHDQEATRFNEARAASPGIRYSLVVGLLPVICFNEARAASPGIPSHDLG